MVTHDSKSDLPLVHCFTLIFPFIFLDFDEDELEAELNELEAEGDMEEQKKLEEELLDVGVTDDLPEIPQAEPAAAKPASAPQKKKKVEEEDPDMAELAAWAS